MVYQHTFKAQLSCEAPNEIGDYNARKTFKNHTINIEGKNELVVSAAKAFKGDATQLNPEDLLLSSLMSCHMMSYLFVCNQHQVKVLQYNDEGMAFLEVNSDGKGRIVKVILSPTVVIEHAHQIELAQSLHKDAGKLCFIANSCNFEIEYNPNVKKCNSNN